MYRCVSWEVEILFVMLVRNCGRMYQCVSWEVEMLCHTIYGMLITVGEGG